MPDPVLTSSALGAFPAADGKCVFRVWAPHARSVAVRTDRAQIVLGSVGDGVFEGRGEARPGDHYEFVLDDRERRADPCSRWQPRGLVGPSRVLDVPALTTGLTRSPVAISDLVIYELHVGTFSGPGTFDGVIPRLPALRELGVTAIQLMPVATFAGDRGWGYDGVYAYAPHVAYGGPAGLARLVQAAHENGLGVILDVVYNHLGAGSDAVEAFGPYTRADEQTVWGGAMDFAQSGVREWAIQNAEMWVRDYSVDGLRLDAAHAIVDDSDEHVMAELARRIKAIDPAVLIISEMEIGDLSPIESWGHDAQWEDSLHHAVHVLLTEEDEGYYARYGQVQDVARELQRAEGRQFVVCAQNHDQVGNRAVGDRLRGRDLRLAAFCSILSGGTPMLFQGEEYDEAHPFQYFTDHIDPKIARATRDGRRREFAAFSDFEAEEIPDPQDAETFRRSKLDPDHGDADHMRYYQELLALRRELPDGPATDVEADEDRRLLRFTRGPATLIANFSDSAQDGVPARTGKVFR